MLNHPAYREVVCISIRTIPLMVALLVTPLSLWADDSQQIYLQQIKPVLQQRCYSCHGASKQESGLRLDTVAFMKHGIDGASVFESQAGAKSSLLERISSDDLSSRMPPEGKPLTAEQIKALEKWIAAGAPAPDDEQPQKDPRQHWAFQAPIRPSLPRNEIADQFDNPIDKLLSIEQIRNELQPLQETDRVTLVRRLYLNVLGIPPTPTELDCFLSDKSAQAYEKLVDQLLERQEYGERWGRHWMDVWRYSDWYGRRSVPDVMNSYPQIWRWRDWIVRSLNQDKGYDRMVQEMLAADELCPTDDENVVATGFLVRNWYKWNYETWMKDNVEHTGKAFLGLTMNCAMCHDHKYDPISHEDYFKFRAFFEPLELRHDRVAGLVDPGPFKKYVYAESYGPIATGAIRVFDEKLDAKTYMFSGGDARNRIEGKPEQKPSPPTALLSAEFRVEAVNLPVEASYPGLKSFVRVDEINKLTAELTKAEAATASATSLSAQRRAEVDDLRQRATQPATASNVPSNEAMLAAMRSVAVSSADHQIAKAAEDTARAKLESLKSRIAADDARYRSLGDEKLLASHASRAERFASFEAAKLVEANAEKALLLAQQKRPLNATVEQQEANKKEESTAEAALQQSRKKVDALRASLAVEDSSYTPLSPSYPSQSTGRRLSLANWITRRENPLTARVAVNHIWLRHFGKAIVESTDNLGVQGKMPEQPALLDWLAVELMDNGWSMKHIHRLIVNSAAFKRTSAFDPQYPANKIDPNNLTYWRANQGRMEAEVVRDSVLACSQTLDKTVGGPEIDPNLWSGSNRRSMYFTIHGEAKMQFLETFDGPNVCECYRRTSTVLPQQALAMTNSELLVDQGRKLASKIKSELDGAAVSVELLDEKFVQLAFRTVLSRSPTNQELQLSLKFLQQQEALFSEYPADAMTVKPANGVVAASTNLRQRARENMTISLFSHNDFVTVR
ncbi:MAG: DUF1553 domain-containing protein [Pirellulales bacterium]